MRTVALVPARGGSRGLPGKNLVEVNGRSLVARAIDVGRSVPAIDEVVVSSDAADILAAGQAAGASVHERHAELASDDAPTVRVVQAFLAERPDITTIVVLQPTSPLRTAADVEGCLTALATAETVTTVTASEHPTEWSFRLGAGGTLEPVLGWDGLPPRRQDASESFRLNGAVYAARANHVRDGGALVGPGTSAVVMPRERSVDIDEELDLVVARAVATWLENGR